ncbi:MAG: class III aminotransferase [Alphaproteobacteria bacterium CG11_big_fil_rev_8_21_14_0_20_44_7]|nr:MAG: class III aminotransferase [Alphaproteobacteria bacterium CG11_big_fil_rev_8_21_14_0_20_44_7]
MQNSQRPQNPIIMIAPNGARKTKEDLRQIPITPSELADEARACMEAGASIVHLHVRDKNQGHTLDAGAYREAIAAIRDVVGDKMIIQATTEAVGIYQPDEQIAAVKELMPEAVSVAIREFIPSKEYEAAAGEFFHFLEDNNIWPQYILYSAEEIAYFADLKQRGLIPAKHDFVLFVLGKKQRVATAENFAKPEDLDVLLNAYKQTGLNLTWAVCAFGGHENECMKYALANGGNARIGFENNHLLSDNNIAASNADLVRQFVETARITPMNAQEIRKLYGLL